MNKTNNLRAYLRDLYEGIVSKKPDASRNPQNFRSEIEAIRTGGEFYEVMDASELPMDAPDGSLALVEGEPIPQSYIVSSVDELPTNAVDGSMAIVESDNTCYIRENGEWVLMGDGVLVCNDEIVMYQTAIKELVCPNAISIPQNAFMACVSITSIDLPNVTSIEFGAFRSCTGLTSIDLPKATSIDEEAFYNCTPLTTVKLPNATNLGRRVFYNTSITSIDLPKATSIGMEAFWCCYSLDTLILRNTETMCNIDLTALIDTKIVTAEGMPSGVGFIYVPTSLYDDYVAQFKVQVTELVGDEAVAEQMSRAILRKIEDYPEICEVAQ